MKYGREMEIRQRHRMKCFSTRRVTAGLLLSFLALTSSAATFEVQAAPAILSDAQDPNTFTLQHIFHHGTYRNPNLHRRLDIHPQSEFASAFDDEIPQSAPPPRLIAKARPMEIERLADRRHHKIEEHLAYASHTGHARVLDVTDWTTDVIAGPNVTDKETVINLAIMAANAYVPIIGEGEWQDVGEGFNHSTGFGWEGDGLRGHIFSNKGNETVIVALKGTSPAVFDGDGTTTRDKLNDNLFFSCCCAQDGRFFWRQVCDCETSTYTCNNTCLVKALKQKTRYYSAALDLYANVTALYPDSDIWVVGHSLGGAVSSLLGLTFGIPVVTFEAPGEDLAARRLGLPAPRHANPNHPYQRELIGSVHFGHTADPIFMGSCNGATSPCTLGGYAMESQCHTGVQCVYDTVEDLGWRVGLGYHRIHDVIDNVIRKYDEVPKCVADAECRDCFNWKYFESNGSDSKTSTTMTKTTSTRTRTETCQTPGWWGCLDGSTSSKPVITTTITTTTCLEPGWFGCNIEGNTTITTTTVPPKSHSVPATTTSSTTITTCETPGWFGCYDPTTTISKHTSVVETSKSTKIDLPTTSCKTPGLFFGCYDETSSSTSPAKTHSITTPPTRSQGATSSASSNKPSTSKSTSSCETPGFFFGCYDRPSTTLTRSSTKTITEAPTSISSSATGSPTGRPHKPKHKCKHPAFFGLICLDDPEDDPGFGKDPGDGDWQNEL